jgi:sugar lactone lactonase YvrE
MDEVKGAIQADVVYRLAAEVGEGCLWDEVRGVLYWVDILDNRVYCFGPSNGANTGYDVGQEVGAVALRPGKGKLLLALRNGIADLDLETGQVTHLVDPEANRPKNRFNDGKCDRQGRFWAGTLPDDLETGAGSLYCIDKDLGVTTKIPQVTISNGLAWSRDQRTFYYIDTPTQKLQAFDYEPQAGAISNPRVVREFAEAEGHPDGMAIDADDRLWVALWGGSRVVCVDPPTGEIVFQVLLPVTNASSCVFGGAGLDELYVTTATAGLTPEELETQPLAGSLFKAKVPFKGLPPNRFGGGEIY